MSSFTLTPMNPQVASGYYFDPDLLPTDEAGQQLANQIFALILPYAEACQRRREQDIAQYGSEHESYLGEMRKLKQQQKELEEEKAWLDSEAIAIDNEFGQARFHLRMARESKLNPMWATADDWTAYNGNVADAKGVFDKVLLRQQDHSLNFASWHERWNTLQDQIRNLADQVSTIWSKLEHAKGNSTARIDRNTGLKQS